MPVNANWPITADQIAFNADPNDVAAMPTWTDLTSRVETFKSFQGRQYETDLNQAGEAEYTFLDPDEYLNPSNTGSPYSPNVKLYRQIIRQAMWPSVPTGGAVNLINTSSTVPMDGTFESYAVSSTPSWISMVGPVTSPGISTTTPFQGSNDFAWTIIVSASTQGIITSPFPCIPGKQYTASLYLHQSTSPTAHQISIPGVATGSTSTVANAYDRLTVTFTATKLTHQIQVVTTVSVTQGEIVRLDAVQLETGASASTFAATGPVIYPVFDAFLERLPSEWRDVAGKFGVCNLTAVDALAILQATRISTEVNNAILAKSPDYLWKLGEASGAAVFGESSGNGGPSLIRYDNGQGPAATFSPGSATNIVGDQGGLGLFINEAQDGTNSPVASSTIQTGRASGPAIVFAGATGGTWSATVGFWATRSATTVTNKLFEIDAINGNFFSTNFSLEFTATNVIVDMPGNARPSITDSWADGLPHFYLLSAVCAAGTSTDKLYVDGVLVSTSSGVAVGAATRSLEVGGAQFAGVYTAPPNSTISHFALWNRALTAGEIADLVSATKGYSGETSGARVARYLSYGWNGATAIDAGASIMGVATVMDKTSILDAINSVSVSENGNFVASPAGVPTFKSRTARYLSLTSARTLGELENPYETGIKFNFDPTYVYNAVTVTRNGGVIAFVEDLPSQKTHFVRNYDRTINVLSDSEAVDAANWLLGQHKNPAQRVQTLSITPSANTSLWPVALGTAIGDRVTVKRRTQTFTMSLDFFVEKISHDNQPGSWVTSFEMSPVSSPVWILDDTTYSVLGTSTVLAY